MPCRTCAGDRSCTPLALIEEYWRYFGKNRSVSVRPRLFSDGSFACVIDVSHGQNSSHFVSEMPASDRLPHSVMQAFPNLKKNRTQEARRDRFDLSF